MADLMGKEAPGQTGPSNERRLPGLEPEIQSVLDAFPFYVLLVDSEHYIIAANDKVKRDLGLDAEKLVGAYCPLVVHGCDHPIPECPLEEAVQENRSLEREIFDPKSARWLNSAIYPTRLVTRQGRPIYLHFVRDITALKNATSELSRSLEHQRALCNLLQALQSCQKSTQVIEVLVDEIVSLSWLGITAAAAGFLVTEKGLEMAAQRNLTPEQLERCQRLDPGECLCGKAAETGHPIVTASTSSEHSIKYDGMVEHQHVVLPISHERRVLGVLTLYLKPEDQMDDFRMGFLDAAIAAAAAALDGQLAREEARQTREKCLAQVIASQEDERKRVARDLHDQLCQSLSGLLLETQSQDGTNASPRLVRNGIEARIRDLIDQVRQMAGQLRPPTLDDYGLESALERHVEQLLTRTGLAIDYQYVSSPEQRERLAPSIEVALYRIAEEALSNVVSHAEASRVSVIVVRQQGKVMLLVEDDGRGFDYATTRKNVEQCTGLVAIQERVALLGGTLSVESTPHKGTTIRAEIPTDAH
jgi:PAS domain S-box-containing protein